MPRYDNYGQSPAERMAGLGHRIFALQGRPGFSCESCRIVWVSLDELRRYYAPCYALVNSKITRQALRLLSARGHDVEVCQVGEDEQLYTCSTCGFRAASDWWAKRDKKSAREARKWARCTGGQQITQVIIDDPMIREAESARAGKMKAAVERLLNTNQQAKGAPMGRIVEIAGDLAKIDFGNGSTATMFVQAGARVQAGEAVVLTDDGKVAPALRDLLLVRPDPFPPIPIQVNSGSAAAALARLDDAVNESVTKGNPFYAEFEKLMRAEMEKVYTQYEDAFVNGQPTAASEAKRRVAELQEAIQKRLAGGNPFEQVFKVDREDLRDDAVNTFDDAVDAFRYAVSTTVGTDGRITTRITPPAYAETIRATIGFNDPPAARPPAYEPGKRKLDLDDD